jgi:hypothetical protein
MFPWGMCLVGLELLMWDSSGSSFYLRGVFTPFNLWQILLKFARAFPAHPRTLASELKKGL